MKRSFFLISVLLIGMARLTQAQTSVDLRTQGKSVDFSAALSTKPSKMGTAIPATCAVGETFFKTDAPFGQNLYGCAPVNTWTLLSGTQYLGGSGIAITGSSIAIEDAVVPIYYTGAGNPTLPCTTGRDFYLDTNTGDAYYCRGTNLWQMIGRAGAGGVGGVVTIGNGGTGQTTAPAAFDALAPTTAKGDLITHNGATNTRLPAGSNGQCLIVDSTAAAGVKWVACAQGGMGIDLGATGPGFLKQGSPGGPVTAASVTEADLPAAAVKTTGSYPDPAWITSLSAGKLLGTLGIANGGTGQTSASAGFNALAPTTTKGDLVAHTGTGNTRVPVGPNGQCLTADSSFAAGVRWGACGSGSGGSDPLGSYVVVNLTNAPSNHRLAAARDNLRLTDGGAAGSLTSDWYPLDTRVAWLKDEFAGRTTTSASIGELGWTAGGSNGTFAVVDGALPNVGLFRVGCSNTANANWGMILLGMIAGGGNRPFGALGATTIPWETKVVFRVNQTTNMRFRVGFATSASLRDPADGFFLRFDTSADTSEFQVESRVAGAASVVSTGVAVDTNFHTVTFRGTGTAEKIAVSMDGGAEKTICPSGGGCDISATLSSNAMLALILIGAESSGAAQTVDVDYFGFWARVSTGAERQ